jgi:peptidyl-prolyl cis-trans isomerase C
LILRVPHRLIERVLVMARRAIIAASLGILLAVPAFAQQKAAPAAAAGDPIVAKVNGQVLHRSDVEMALHSAPAQAQQAPLDKVYPQILGTMINGMLLADAGRKAKIDQNPQVKQQLYAADTDIIADAYVASLARSQITEAKLKDAYNQYAAAAPKQEEVSARHILVATEQEAKDIIAQLKGGADFAALAKEKTTDPSGKTNGGDLGYFTQQEMVPEFASAAFALKKGEYTQTPVHTQFGWHVIKVDDRRPGQAAPYEQVAPQIAQQMTQSIVAAKLKELTGQAKVEVFDLNGKPLAMGGPPPGAAPAAPASAPAAAPVLSLPGGGSGAAAPGAPTLSPATAPDALSTH